METATTELAELLAIDEAAQDLLFREARTANAFSAEPVSDEQVAALYDLVRWGPTSMNAQPLRLVVVRSPEARERLVSHMFDGNKAKTSQAPISIVVAWDDGFHEQLPELFPHKPGAKELFGDPARRAAFARDQAWLQTGYLIVGIRALGLAAGPMGGFDASGVDADLLAGTSLRSLVVINVGTADEGSQLERLPRHHADVAITTL